MTASLNEFDIAKSISDLLKDLKPEQRQRVLRWVGESLGLAPGNEFSISPAPVRTATASTMEVASHRSASSERATDIKSFIESKNPKSDVQFTTAVAYYYRFEAPPEQRTEILTTKLLQDAARLSNRNRFSNPRIPLNNAKKQGYLDSSAPGSFKINSVGENLVVMTLPGNGGTRAMKTRKPKKRSKKRR